MKKEDRRKVMYFLVEIFEKMASEYRFLGWFYKKLYTGFVENEIIAANITKEDKGLHVGCGSLPYTSLIMAEKTGAEVTAIDIDPVAVERARAVLPNVKLANADSFDFAGFDVVIVSCGVRPKREILSRIFRSFKKGGRLVYRNPKKLIGFCLNCEKIFFTTKGILRFTKGEVLKQCYSSFRESVVVVK